MAWHDEFTSGPADPKAGARFLEDRLCAEASSQFEDPPDGMHSRIMAAVRAHHRSSGEPGAEAIQPWRRMAAAASLAIIAGGLMFVALRQPNPRRADSSIVATAGHREVSEPSSRSANSAAPRAAIDDFLGHQVLAVQSELMRPLRGEFDRIASASDQLLRSTLSTFPPSLRSAVAGR